ncbi:MAG: NAD(P)H-dependent glycerol-3-phosphate dehydrogenase [Isosphaeraceae bacterium]
MLKRIAILGAGGMGTALSILFARTARSVQLWSRDSARAAELAHSRENLRHLPGVPVPETVFVTHLVCDATAAADLIVVAVPSAFLRQTLLEIAERLPPGVPILSVVKGIENGTFARPSQIITEVLGDRSVAILSGPSHAEEFARGLPASVVVTGWNESLLVQVRDVLNQGMFRVYINEDVVGVELAGALKNILGIAAGVCEGLGLGDNARAALLTRGLAEITRFGVAFGGQPSTFYGLAGVGDLMTTSFSRHGRNRSVGERMGRGETLEQILANMVNVAEGVPTTRSVHDQARQRGVEVPITDELFRVLFEAKPPRAALADLMVRLPRHEW